MAETFANVKGFGALISRGFCSHRVITYVLLCGYQPFRSDDPNEVAKETMRGRIEFHERYWKNVSDEGGSVKVDQGVGHDRVC